MKKYQVTLWEHGTDVNSISLVDIERETKKCVWVHGSRESKRSVHINYCDTWEEAYLLLVADARKHVESALKNLDDRTEELHALLKMKRQ